MVEIETLRHVYIAIVAYFIKEVKSLHGLTGYLIRNVCTEFGIYIYQFFVVIFVKLRDLAGGVFVIYTLPIVNNSSALH